MSSSPALTHKFLDGTEKVLPVGAKPIIIGRLPESEIQVHDAFISRVHAGISYSNQQYVLKDFGSTNGTYRNGARVFVDPESLKYLDGCHLDYVEALNDSGFKIENPNAARSCGCGTSFEPAKAGAAPAYDPATMDGEVCGGNN